MILPAWDVPKVLTHVTDSDSAEEIIEKGIKLPARSTMMCSNEGLAFSVGLHPKTWVEILGEEKGWGAYGTPPFVILLHFKPPAFDLFKYLDGRDIAQVEEITSWATKNGWIKIGQDAIIHEPEAVSETLQYNEENSTYRVPSNHPELRWLSKGAKSVEYVDSWRFTGKLNDRVRKHYLNLRRRCRAAEVINLWLTENHPQFGMVWYAYDHSSRYGMAPSGGILPHHFKSVDILDIETLSSWKRVAKTWEESKYL